MPLTRKRPGEKTPVSPPGAGKRDRRGSAVLAVGVLCAALLPAGALTSCNRAESRRVAADAQDAARQAAAGLNHAAAEAKPAADRAARDAKRGVDDMAIAAGKATRKAGVQLEHAGERSQQGLPPPTASGSN